MAQQLIQNGDTGLQARTKINENDTELYARENTPVSNATEYLYVKGDATTDDSIRFSIDATTGNLKSEIRVSGSWEKGLQELRAIDFDTSAALLDYKAGRISYDAACKTLLADTGYTDVRNELGRETHAEVYNATATQINNGDPVATILTFTGELPNVVPTDSSNILLTRGFVGIATMDIPAGTAGVVTTFGKVHGLNTLGFSQGFIYIDDAGGYTQTRPVYPNERLLVGAISSVSETEGVISVASQYIPRRSASRGYTFSSADAGIGVHYRAGYYDWSATSVALTQASSSVTYGTSGRTKAAHVGIVPSAAGTVDTGQVGLQVTGTLDSELGTQTAAQTAVITEDITTLTADTMIECLEKFSGDVVIEFYTVSGTPTTYSLTFNYGFSKYEDFANIDGTVTAFSAVWEAGANDSSFNIELMHHKATGWTYAASGFVAGNSNICERLVDQSLDPNIAIGESGAYKRINLDTFIDGSATEGIIIRITTGSNNSIRTMDMSVTAFSEELN